MTPEYEIRSLDHAPTLTGDGNTLVGYAATWNQWSEDLGGFREIIRPGSFKTFLSTTNDVRALIDHDDQKLLGRTSSGTLKLTEDPTGLKYELSLPDVSYARDLKSLMQRGDVTKSSFAFQVAPQGQKWGKDKQGNTRELTALILKDVSPVTSYPAYASTSVALRSLGELLNKEIAEKQNRQRNWLRQVESEL